PGAVRRRIPARDRDRDPDHGAWLLLAARCHLGHHLVLRARRLGSPAPARQPRVTRRIGRPVSQAIGVSASAAVQVLASGWARLAWPWALRKRRKAGETGAPEAFGAPATTKRSRPEASIYSRSSAWSMS